MSNLFIVFLALFCFAAFAEDDLTIKASLEAKKNSKNPSATMNFLRKQEIEGRKYFDFEFKTTPYRMDNGVCIYEHEYVTVELIESNFHPLEYEHNFLYGLGGDCASVDYFPIKGNVFVLDVFEIKRIIDKMFADNNRSLLADDVGFSKDFIDEIFNAQLFISSVEEIDYGVLKFSYVARNSKNFDMVSFIVETDNGKIKSIKITAGSI